MFRIHSVSFITIMLRENFVNKKSWLHCLLKNAQTTFPAVSHPKRKSYLLLLNSRPAMYQVVVGDYDRGSFDGSEEMITVHNRTLVGIFSSVWLTGCVEAHGFMFWRPKCNLDLQKNFSGSNTDGSFTTAVSNSFLSPLGKKHSCRFGII